MVGAGKRRREVAELVTVVGDRLAQKLEGNNARVTVWLLPGRIKDAGLVHGCSNVDDVVAGLEEQILDVEGTDLFVTNVVDEGDITLSGKVSTGSDVYEGAL